MQIDITLGSNVYTVCGIHIYCAFDAKFQPGLAIGMNNVEKVSLIAHGDLMAKAGSQTQQGIVPI